MILQALTLADILKISEDDFQFLFPGMDEREACEEKERPKPVRQNNQEGRPKAKPGKDENKQQNVDNMLRVEKDLRN